MLWDMHMHSRFSGDSDAPQDAMIDAAVAKGLGGIALPTISIWITPADLIYSYWICQAIPPPCWRKGSAVKTAFRYALVWSLVCSRSYPKFIRIYSSNIRLTLS